MIEYQICVIIAVSLLAYKTWRQQKDIDTLAFLLVQVSQGATIVDISEEHDDDEDDLMY